MERRAKEPLVEEPDVGGGLRDLVPFTSADACDVGTGDADVRIVEVVVVTVDAWS